MTTPTAAQEAKAIKGVREMFASNRQAKAFFTSAATRKNDVAETPVDSFQAMAGNIERLDAVAIMKGLEELGIGTFVTGRSGHKTRLEWNYSLPNVGKVAIGEAKSLVEVGPDAEREPPEVISRIKNPAMVNGQEQMTIPLAKQLIAQTLGIHASKVLITVTD